MKGLLLIALSLALLSSPALAQDSAWTITSRTLSAPVATSDALRASIANTRQPDVAEHIQQTTFTTREEWVQVILAANAGNTQRAEALAERWAVTIAEAEIGRGYAESGKLTEAFPGGIENMLQHYIPEVVEVRAVA